MAQSMAWYFSDGAAIQYESTTEQVGLRSEWAMSIQRSPGLERVIHYRAGRPVTTWVRFMDSSGQLSREAVEVDGRMIEERVFSTGQHLELERQFLPDGSVEETRYIRDGNRLMASTQFKDGNEIGSRVYLYYPDGRLAGVRELAGGRHIPSGTERPKSGKTTSWTSGPEGLILSFYDDTGRLAGNRNYRGAVLVSSEERIWRDDTLISLRIEWHETGTYTVSNYDQAGRLESRMDSRGKEIISFHEYVYDSDGRLVSEKRETPDKLETIEYVYGLGEKVLSEIRMVNGLRTFSRVYTELDEMLEEYYDKGRLFSRVLYKNGKKVLETIFSNGKPVRERKF
mgnify:CR=1 FL=1